MSENVFPWKQEICICAEIGNNHGGDVTVAKEMIRRAAQAGAHAVKFQTIHPGKLVHPALSTVAHAQGEHATQLERLQKICLPDDAFEELKACADKHHVLFLSTPFDEEAVDILDPLVPAFKVSSGDITNIPLLKHIAKKGKPVIISTGMASQQEIQVAVGLFPIDTVMLLHCVTQYPTPFENVNLMRIVFLKNKFNCAVGYSDHSCGVDACVFAAALGATFIEKHFTLDKSQPRGDHALSADPDDMQGLVTEIERFEKSIRPPIGNITEIKRTNRFMMRRSLYAARDIAAGDVVTREHIIALRPEEGMSPDKIDSIIGRKVKEKIAAHTLIKMEMFEQ